MSRFNVMIPSDDEVENLSLTVYRRCLEACKHIDLTLRVCAKLVDQFPELESYGIGRRRRWIGETRTQRRDRIAGFLC